MKSKIRRIAKVTLIVFALLLLAGLVFPTWTPAIKEDNSISVLKSIEINGAEHTVMIRGVNRDNPVLLFVHGGPGSSEIPYVRKYQRLLEQEFTVVHYDQRGAGKSYRFFHDYSGLTTDLLVDDLIALTDYVLAELGADKLLLAGHSFGTYIGMKAAAQAPERYAAYIGIGQVADAVASELDSLAYVIDQATLAGDAADIERAERLRDEIARGERLTPRELVRKYGGASRLIDDNMDYYTGFLLHPEYNLLDVLRYVRGVSATQGPLLDEVLKQPLPEQVERLEIPAYFVMGQYDYMTSVQSAQAYFDKLDAPRKDFVVFEHSAHFPQFEEEEAFARWLSRIWSELQRGLR